MKTVHVIDVSRWLTDVILEGRLELRPIGDNSRLDNFECLAIALSIEKVIDSVVNHTREVLALGHSVTAGEFVVEWRPLLPGPPP